MTTVTAETLERIELPVRDGTTMAAYVARPPQATANAPGVLVLQDAFGVTGFLRDVAVRFALEQGCVAIAPELYHRTGDNVVIPYEDRAMTGCRPHQEKMTPEGMIDDAVACYDWLVGSTGVPADRVAAMGFCMGGRLSYLANSELPLAAGISLYGRVPERIYKYAATQHGELVMMWGGKDHEIPPEHYRGVTDALTACGAKHAEVVFSEAGHGFFCHTRPWMYSPDDTRLAWALTLEVLRTTKVLR